MGNYHRNTWLERTDNLIQLGEYHAAITNLEEATVYYPSRPEIKCRLAGLYFILKEFNNGIFYLKNALRLDSEILIEFEMIFPKISKDKKILRLIEQQKNPSH